MFAKTTAAAGLALAACALSAAPATAAVTHTRSATKVAKAIATRPSQVVSARWLHLPPEGRPAAVGTTRLVGFPRAGRSFAVLSTGDATAIDDPNADEALSNDLNGPPVRGARDATVLRVDVRVPRGARCLSVAFRFLSDEFDEFVESPFNDAFVAELGRSSWTALGGDRVRATRNFAFDRERQLISVNRTGDFSVTRERARGTTYDGGTRRLRASKPVRPGLQRVFFSIFDQGDRQYDSSVVLDQLSANRRRPCRSGAALD
jgi:hypothetical protein